jgi:hypothetical protein
MSGGIFDHGMKEGYDRLARQEIEMARYIRDIINKSDDTKQVYKLLTDMLQAYESRVLLDSGEGKHPDGSRYTPEDFWTNVGEVRGLRWLQSKVRAMIKKADDADEEKRRKPGKPE